MTYIGRNFETKEVTEGIALEMCDKCCSLKAQLDYKIRIEQELRKMLDDSFLYIRNLETIIQTLRNKEDNFKKLHG